ncbi:hypothetical protein PC119_g9998 [Phytophthora cactorum]|uniref:Uncharacterized protein n=1 Tax=Phytophthora cactorum TaxID=29920 RepID=A0A8T1EQT1_9STRA|nr:hypothetical protein PC117_g757 [Phytophthora cactorum]KAG3020389.1 hypothetical protein PC119_g9998 [Phytophthora cactorum]
MHLATETTAARAQASDVGINIADFSRKNKLQPAPSATSLHQILSALQNLKVFSRKFYQDTVSNGIDKALRYLGQYGESDFRHTHMCQAIVFWISFKLSKFRARVLAGDMALAALVAGEFCRIDPVLAEINEYYGNKDPRHDQSKTRKIRRDVKRQASRRPQTPFPNKSSMVASVAALSIKGRMP